MRNYRYSPARLRLLTIGAFTLSMVTLGSLWSRFGRQGLDVADKLGSVVSAAVSVGSLAFTAIAAHYFVKQRAGRSHQNLMLARQDLLQAVRRQWLEESRLRSLRRPTPLRVTWTTMRTPTLVHAEVTRSLDQMHGGVDEPELSGDLAGAVALFEGSPYRQMVVLGGPGAGKTVTAILLTLHMLDQIDADQASSSKPVPVLVSPVGWNPHRELFSEWLTRHILEMYPWLAAKDNGAARTVDELIQGRHLLPIIDGFDEMPPELQSAALDAIDESVPTDQPIILTSRTSEYESAVSRSEAPLPGQVVIELQPPSIEDVATFLLRGRRGSRWQAVLDRLRADSGGPLATALSTPLMVALARAGYSDQSANPDDLLRFPSAAAVQDHLLKTFVRSVYARSTQPSATDADVEARRPYDPRKAERWLKFLARYLVRNDKEDLDWAELGRAVPTGALIFVAGALGAVPLAIVTWSISGPAIAMVTGLTVALSFALMAFLAAPLHHPPRRVVLRLDGPPQLLARSCLAALPFGLAFAGAFGAVAALVAGWSDALVTSAITTIGLTLVLGLLGWIDASDEKVRAENPQSVLRSDRVASLANAAAFGIIVSIATGLPAAGALGTAWGSAAGLCIGMLGLAPVALLFTAWGRFTMARVWLALRGDLPIDLVRFMDDAHRRGVLRQVGATYRFRHSLLRDRLAELDSGDAAQQTDV